MFPQALFPCQTKYCSRQSQQLWVTQRLVCIIFNSYFFHASSALSVSFPFFLFPVWTFPQRLTPTERLAGQHKAPSGNMNSVLWELHCVLVEFHRHPWSEKHTQRSKELLDSPACCSRRSQGVIVSFTISCYTLHLLFCLLKIYPPLFVLLFLLSSASLQTGE